jgi:hypothetical protein
MLEKWGEDGVAMVVDEGGRHFNFRQFYVLHGYYQEDFRNSLG